MWMRIALLAALASTGSLAQSTLNERVLVVYTEHNKASLQVAKHYMEARGIPASHLCGIQPFNFKTPRLSFDSVDFHDYESVVRNPVRKCLERVGKQQILYIVMSYETPFKLTGVPPHVGSAIDSYLADVWDTKGGLFREANPYFAAHTASGYGEFVSLGDFRNAAGAALVYSVWRLDAATPALAMGLVDKAIVAEKEGLRGNVCIDRQLGDIQKVEEAHYGIGDWELYRAGESARKAGFQVLEDANRAEFGTAPAPSRCDDAALYAGWYALNSYNDVFTWKAGAIGFHLDSLSAASPRTGGNWAANAIAHGIAVTSGVVNEPYLGALPRAGGVFLNLFQGANVGDAFFRNTAFVRWQNMNLGDPLYRPFPGGVGEFRKK